jgi:predicted phosphodiesterase
LLKGNHEEYFISNNYPGQNIIAKSFFNYCFPKFDVNLLNNIKEYEEELLIEEHKIKHTIGSQYIFKDTDLSDIFVDNNYIIGHSHQQYIREKDKFKIYNTGSIGQNRKFINQSCYLQINTKLNTVELKSFIHDINKVINKMKERKYPQICIDYYLSKEIL